MDDLNKALTIDDLEFVSGGKDTSLVIDLGLVRIYIEHYDNLGGHGPANCTTTVFPGNPGGGGSTCTRPA
jgi:hypothetical protein